MNKSVSPEEFYQRHKSFMSDMRFKTVSGQHTGIARLGQFIFEGALPDGLPEDPKHISIVGSFYASGKRPQKIAFGCWNRMATVSLSRPDLMVVCQNNYPPTVRLNDKPLYPTDTHIEPGLALVPAKYPLRANKLPTDTLVYPWVAASIICNDVLEEVQKRRAVFKTNP